MKESVEAFTVRDSVHGALKKRSQDLKTLPEGQTKRTQEQRVQTREDLSEVMRQFIEQQAGIAKTISAIKHWAEHYPNDIDGIRDIIQQSVARFKLNPEQIQNFNNACDAYEKKHSAVEDCAKRYPEASDLFEACFGEAPVGRVKVVKKPMTLHFQCDDPEDYAWAYSATKNINDQASVTKEMMARASLSIGCAKRHVLIPALDGCVTLENMSKYERKFFREVEERVDLQQNRVDLMIGQFIDEATVNVKDVGVWKIQAKGSAQEIVLIEPGMNEDVVQANIWRTSSKIGRERKEVLQVQNILDSHGVPTEVLSFPMVYEQNGKKVTVGTILVDYFGITIYGDFPHGSEVRSTSLEPILEPINEHDSKKVQLHEEVHQWNKLFTPFESEKTFFRSYDIANRRGKNPEEVKKLFVMDVLRHNRQELIDPFARDEVIAYYAEQMPLSEIYRILTTSPLYDYYTKFFPTLKNLIDKIPADAKKHINPDLAIDPDEVKKLFDPIFDVQYKRDLHLWMRGIETLEEKGYSRKEILSFLAQEPATNWLSMARRLSPKQGEETYREQRLSKWTTRDSV